jgi:hypothetical protein
MSELSSAPTLRDRFQALNVTTSREAAILAAQGQRATLWRLVVTPFLVFLDQYIRQGAWRRRKAGLVDAVFASYTDFVRQAKLWEMYNMPEKPPPPPPPLA